MGLDLDKLRQVSLERCEAPNGFKHPLIQWSVLDWAGASAGELGEAANIAKKLLRIRLGNRGNHKPGEDSDLSLRHRLAHEIADTVIYLDLWAASEGIDLGEAIREAFNSKSDEIGYPGKI